MQLFHIPRLCSMPHRIVSMLASAASMFAAYCASVVITQLSATHGFMSGPPFAFGFVWVNCWLTSFKAKCWCRMLCWRFQRTFLVGDTLRSHVVFALSMHIPRLRHASVSHSSSVLMYIVCIHIQSTHAVPVCAPTSLEWLHSCSTFTHNVCAPGRAKSYGG